MQLPLGLFSWTYGPYGVSNSVSQTLPVGTICQFFGCYSYITRGRDESGRYNTTRYIFEFNTTSCIIGEIQHYCACVSTGYISGERAIHLCDKKLVTPVNSILTYWAMVRDSNYHHSPLWSYLMSRGNTRRLYTVLCWGFVVFHCLLFRAYFPVEHVSSKACIYLCEVCDSQAT